MLIVPIADGVTAPPVRGYLIDAYVNKAKTDAWLAAQRAGIGGAFSDAPPQPAQVRS